MLVEKPLATKRDDLPELSDFLDQARGRGLRFLACHPREFGEAWGLFARLLGNPQEISKLFGVGPMGQLEKILHDCLYTRPGTEGKHESFADDKLNHNMVSVLRALSRVSGFSNAVMLHNDPTEYSALMVTVSDDPTQRGIVIEAAGSRTADPKDGRFWRDTASAEFTHGTLTLTPWLGKMILQYGATEIVHTFDPKTVYDDMFRGINRAFVESVLDPTLPDPLPSHVQLLGTAAAILMQQPDFDGEISRATIERLRTAR